MTRVEVIPFEPEHLTMIDFPVENAAEMDPLTLGKAHKAMGPCASLAIAGHVYASGGLTIHWKGTAEMWATIGKERPLSVLGAMKRQVNAWVEEYGLDRVQAITDPEWKGGCRFLEWLGFTMECRLRKMGPNGVDKALYARVR